MSYDHSYADFWNRVVYRDFGTREHSVLRTLEVARGVSTSCYIKLAHHAHTALETQWCFANASREFRRAVWAHARRGCAR